MATPAASVGQNPSEGNPDIVYCVWPNAFDHAVQKIVDCLFKCRTLVDLFEANTEFLNVLVTDVVKPKIRVAIDSGVLTWKLDNARFTVRADEMALATLNNFVTVVSGSITVTIEVTPAAIPLTQPSLNVRINLSSVSSPGRNLSEIDDTPSPPTDNKDENAEGGDTGNGFRNTIEISFRLDPAATDSDAKKRKRTCTDASAADRSDGEPSRKRKKTDDIVSTERSINQELCNCLLQTFADMVLEQMRDCLLLPASPLPSDAIEDDGPMFVVGEMSMPEFRNGYLVFNHLSGLRYKGEAIQSPTPVLPFPNPQSAGRMLTIFISNSVFNTVGRCLHEHHILRHNLTQADIAPQPIPGKESSGKTRFLADCFPEFHAKYPNASVEVDMATTDAPTTKFSGTNLKMTLTAAAIFRARLPDGNAVDLLKSKVIVESVVAGKLDVGRLFGNVTSVRPKTITYDENDQMTVNNVALKDVFNLIASRYLSKKLDEVAQTGLSLPGPRIPGLLQFQNTLVRGEENHVRVDTDLKFRTCLSYE